MVHPTFLTLLDNIEQYRAISSNIVSHFDHSPVLIVSLVCLLLLIIVASFEWIVCPCTNIECMQQQPHRVRVHSDQCFKLSSNLDRAASCILQFILSSFSSSCSSSSSSSSCSCFLSAMPIQVNPLKLGLDVLIIIRIPPLLSVSIRSSNSQMSLAVSFDWSPDLIIIVVITRRDISGDDPLLIYSGLSIVYL